MAMVSAVCIANREPRVLISARRLGELKAGAENVEIEAIEPVERTARTLQAPELLPLQAAGSERRP